MFTIQHTTNFRIEKPSIVTIGTFDGVHLGHQKILNRLKALKEKTGFQTVVLTFDPHPRKVLFPSQNDLKLITLTHEKTELLKLHGIDVCVVYPFDKEFSNIDATFYIEQILVKSLNVKHLVIGYDHKFGKNREGDITILKKFSTQFNFEVEEVSALDIDNIAISSSKIRKSLDDGNVEIANNYLGYPFLLTAKVVKGKQLGNTIGFPTANLKLMEAEKIIPKIGVYFVQVQVEAENYFGMMNIGYNPTTDDSNSIKQEVNIFDFEGNLYEKFISIKFIKRLRDELKFDGLQSLINQLKIDKQNCLNLISEINH